MYVTCVTQSVTCVTQLFSSGKENVYIPPKSDRVDNSRVSILLPDTEGRYYLYYSQ